MLPTSSLSVSVAFLRARRSSPATVRGPCFSLACAHSSLAVADGCLWIHLPQLWIAYLFHLVPLLRILHRHWPRYRQAPRSKRAFPMSGLWHEQNRRRHSHRGRDRPPKSMRRGCHPFPAYASSCPSSLFVRLRKCLHKSYAGLSHSSGHDVGHGN